MLAIAYGSRLSHPAKIKAGKINNNAGRRAAKARYNLGTEQRARRRSLAA